MAGVSKNNPGARTGAGKDAVHVKWVRKAHMWAKTTIKDGKQQIEFFSKGDKPNG